MKVTKLKYQKKDPSRVNLYIDDEFFCGISLNTLAKENLYESMDIGLEDLDRIVLNELKERFLTRATEYLLKSPKSEFQIYRYLKNLAYKKKDIWYKEDISLNWDMVFDEIVEKLKSYKYIDDENFARMFVQSRIKNRPRGKIVLVGELMSKGISKDIAQKVCEEEVVDEEQLLKDTFEKKYRGEKFDISNRKMVNFLLRKGFNWDLIRKFSNNDS